MAAVFKEKLTEAVRKYTCLYNKQSPDFKDKSKRKFFYKMMEVTLLFSTLENFANPYISLSWCWYFQCFSFSLSWKKKRNPNF